VPDWAIRTKADEAAIAAGCWWDQERSDRIVKFAHAFFSLKYSHERFRLFPEQELFLRSLEGWRTPKDWRRFRTANLHVPKKLFGKTTICALLAMYELFCSEEKSPFVICGAAAQKNTEQMWKAIRTAIDHSPFGALKPNSRRKEYQHIRPLDSRLRLTVPANGAELWCVASDGDRIHGETTSLVVLDEVHAHKDRTLHDSLCYSMKTRRNGLLVCISTSGDDVNHFYRTEIYAKSKRVLSGEDLDPTWYAQVYEADPGCDPEDPAQWVKANPLLGRADFADLDQFRAEMESAKSTGIGKWMTFCRYSLNLWLAASSLAWLSPGDEWDGYQHQPDEETLQTCPVAVGVDCSDSGIDPTSVSITWALPDGRYFTRSHAWVTSDGVTQREASNLPKYQQYQFGGHMTVTDGNMIDADRVRDYILTLCRTYDVRVVNWDVRDSYVLARQIQNEGYTCERVPPNARYYNAPLREFAKAYKAGRIMHDGSPWLRFCLGNVRLELNAYEECYPVRNKSVDKIDSAISTLLSFAGLLSQQRQLSSIMWR
jgi:phage terminase large subunit-like protein